MQQRRGTAAQWTAANPILAAGEIGFETDTSRFKMGNGSSTWSALTYFANAAELTALLDGAPEALNTLNELAAAIGDDADFVGTVTAHTSATTNVHGIADTAALATTAGVNSAIDVAAGVLTGQLSTVANNLSFHTSETTDVHGIDDVAALVLRPEIADFVTQTELTDAISGAAGEYPNLAGSGLEWNAANEQFDVDATIATLDYVDTAKSEAIDAAAEGATEKANEATQTAADALASHNLETTGVHGIADTALLATMSYADQAEADAILAAGSAADTKVSAHNAETENVHGISDTSLLETQTGAQSKADLAQGAAENYADSLASNYDAAGSATASVSSHNDETTSVHGIADTADLLLRSGGTMTGALTLSGEPSSSLHAATKQYVDNTASGVVAKPQVLAATSTNLATTYSNGTAGVGGTLTHTSNGAWPETVAGATGWVVGSGILVKNQTNKAENGRYYVSDLGSASTPWVLTRCGYCDEADEIPGAYIFVQGGTLAGTGWIQTVADPSTFVVGTDEINVFQFSGSGTITAGTNVSVSGNEVSVIATPSLSGVTFSDGTQTKAGVPSITAFATAISSSATLASGEQDKFVPLTGAVTITLPASGYSTGQSIDFYQASGTGAQFASTNSVVGTPGLKLRTTNSVATAMKTSSGWLVFGDLSA